MTVRWQLVESQSLLIVLYLIHKVSCSFRSEPLGCGSDIQLAYVGAVHRRFD